MSLVCLLARLACRSVIEKMESTLSEVRRKNVKAPRSEVWKDAFKDISLLGMMKKIYGDDLSIPAAAEAVVMMYAHCSSEIHSPGYEVIPIKLGFLNEKEARVMVQLCEMYPVRYQVYDSNGSPVDNAAYGGVVYD